MSTEYRFSHPDYDILTNPDTDSKKHIIGNARSDSFAWCDFNGFYKLQDVKVFLDKNPDLVIRDDSDNIVSFEDFSSMVNSKQSCLFARPLKEIEELENLLYSSNHVDRIKAAKAGYRLDILVNDECWLVREAVAHQGYGLDKLIRDDELDVEVAVLLYLEDIGMDCDIKKWISLNPDKCALTKPSLEEVIDSAANRAGCSANNSSAQNLESERRY